jgi:hypothetical protein
MMAIAILYRLRGDFCLEIDQLETKIVYDGHVC